MIMDALGRIWSAHSELEDYEDLLDDEHTAELNDIANTIEALLERVKKDVGDLDDDEEVTSAD